MVGPEAGAPAFLWDRRRKTGYLLLQQERQTVDGRLGMGYAVGVHGFAAGQVRCLQPPSPRVRDPASLCGLLG